MIRTVGTIDQFDQQTLKRYFKGILLTNIKDYISKQFIQNQISFLEIHSHLKDISNGIFNDLKNEFLTYGIELVNFNVNEIAPPEDDPSYRQLKNAFAKKAEMSVLGFDYQQERAFNVLDKAAANEGSSGDIMGAGMGIGMGLNLGNILGGSMGNAMKNIQPETENTKKVICAFCGKELADGAKFCLECGKKVEPDNEMEKMVTCPLCNAIVPEGKFCLECGGKLEIKCSNCGAKVIPGAKFCLECGNKI